MVDDARCGTIRLGYRLSLATVVLTVVSFALALLAVPNSGRNCRSDCLSYPFTGPVASAQFPADYLWLFPALVLMLVVVALAAAVHGWAGPEQRTATLIGLCFATLAAGILAADYHLQATVIQPALERGQGDGLSLLIQYNPNGVFLALEELGYLVLGLSLACSGVAFTGTGRAGRIVRATTSSGFLLAVVAFLVVSAVHGLDRQDTFEVAVITIVWLVLIIAGAAEAAVFHRQLRPVG